MHIPDSMLQGTICPVTALISVAGVIAATWWALKSESRPSAARFAAIVALIFAGQMMNFPISNGTSGHLLGGVLAATFLGTPLAILAIALVVTIQCLVFSDGGITVLGANVLNMALIGAGIGGLLQQSLTPKLGKYIATTLAAWSSVVLAAFAVSVELALAGTINFAQVLPAMLGTHAWIGLGEALISVIAVVVLANEFANKGEKMSIAIPLGIAAMVSFFLSPLASSFPDGLEWVGEQYQFLHESAPAFVGVMPDYTIAAISNESLSTGVAGLLGVTLSFVVAFIVWRSLSKTATQP
ncbi:MAG: energy-coupling factor ABC transporter permease [Thiofilum sp.]|uniref:energy-coupling factor ABC transporter permease n=1 Tax=Thiofilum sp. TaxID=2212733 RepID=UPI0025CE2DF5|nr:energy-coupling factor ABC transporter permease [Thiofilum sp.]MBK8455125.1 energy-coupling factor ABC transporter permease [Thiofilum sp.]